MTLTIFPSHLFLLKMKYNICQNNKYLILQLLLLSIQFILTSIEISFKNKSNLTPQSQIASLLSKCNSIHYHQYQYLYLTAYQSLKFKIIITSLVLLLFMLAVFLSLLYRVYNRNYYENGVITLLQSLKSFLFKYSLITIVIILLYLHIILLFYDIKISGQQNICIKYQGNSYVKTQTMIHCLQIILQCLQFNWLFKIDYQFPLLSYSSNRQILVVDEQQQNRVELQMIKKARKVVSHRQFKHRCFPKNRSISEKRISRLKNNTNSIIFKQEYSSCKNRPKAQKYKSGIQYKRININNQINFISRKDIQRQYEFRNYDSLRSQLQKQWKDLNNFK